MAHWQIRVDWSRSSERIIIMAARCADAPAGRWRFVAWDPKAARAIGGDTGFEKDPGAKFEIESHAAQAADILADQIPAHPLAVQAEAAQSDLEAWRRVGGMGQVRDGCRAALRRKYRAVDKLLVEARRVQAGKTKTTVAGKKGVEGGHPDIAVRASTIDDARRGDKRYHRAAKTPPGAGNAPLRRAGGMEGHTAITTARARGSFQGGGGVGMTSRRNRTNIHTLFLWLKNISPYSHDPPASHRTASARPK